MEEHCHSQKAETPLSNEPCGKYVNQSAEKHNCKCPRQKSYSCQYCEKSFSRSSHLQNHERIHTGDRPYSCEHCSKSFTDSSSLRIHERNHTGERPYSCRYCEKSFTKSCHLKSHERIHTGEKPYSCEHCGQTFAQVGHLQCHERTHTGEKPYSCEYCEKSFARPAHLQNHQRIHTGERPYSCEYCGKSFTRSSDLLSHKRIHTKEKPFACEYCGKSFTKSGQLKNHTRIHTGERPYSCEHCGQSFNQFGHLQTHKRIHTGEKPYSCEHCGKSFATSSSLRKHLNTHKRNEPYLLLQGSGDSEVCIAQSPKSSDDWKPSESTDSEIHHAPSSSTYLETCNKALSPMSGEKIEYGWIQSPTDSENRCHNSESSSIEVGNECRDSSGISKLNENEAANCEEQDLAETGIPEERDLDEDTFGSGCSYGSIGGNFNGGFKEDTLRGDCDENALQDHQAEFSKESFVDDLQFVYVKEEPCDD